MSELSFYKNQLSSLKIFLSFLEKNYKKLTKILIYFNLSTKFVFKFINLSSASLNSNNCLMIKINYDFYLIL